MEKDSAGNLYIAGRSEGTPNPQKAVLLKYNTSGNLIWSSTYTNFHFAQFTDIAIDNEQNVYVVGYADSIASNNDLIVWKFDSTGTVIWNSKYVTGSSEEGLAIYVDLNGNVYVTGEGNHTTLTIKFDSNGQLLWHEYYFTASMYSEDIIVDSSGNSYILGYNVDADSMAIVKYDPNGNLLWVRQSPSANPGETANLHFDKNGNIIVCGYGVFLTVIKYSQNGERIWNYNHFPVPFYATMPFSSILDENDNVFVTGSISSPNGIIVTLKLDSSGQLIWDNYYSTSSSDNGLGSDICLDDSGNVYITGFSTEQNLGFIFDEDYITIKYSPQGDILWKKLFNGASNTLDRAWGIQVDSTGVYVTGEAVISGLTTDIVTIKYSLITGIQTLYNELPGNFSLSQNYPNPFNPSTNINFEIARTSNVKLVVYDALGREVSVLANETMKPGIYSANFDAEELNSGVYFYSLITDGFKETKKMILLK
ncbi:MAG: T9SS type A sorting domain-containing protein [Ignavibacteriae bacterium]|nr:T9SS type A sorting domain-containing protein [Ignavibacteriota bacterium]MCB9244484.1 T9SS type A sorting domain-containing protein [Ignavibacteriales bacterium]